MSERDAAERVGELLERLPPWPWRWEQVRPAQSRLDPDPEPAGMALVAADSSWILWSEGGYGTPDVTGGSLYPGRELPPAARFIAEAAELLAELAGTDRPTRLG